MESNETASSAPPRPVGARIRKYTRPLCEGVDVEEPVLRGVQKGLPAGFTRCIIEVGAAMPLDSHDEHEIWVVTRGHGTLTRGGEVIELGCGDMVFFESGITHQFTNGADEPFELVSIYWAG